MTIKNCSKWHDLYGSWTNNGGTQSNAGYLEGGNTSASSQARQPRGRTNSKAKEKQEASLQAILDTIKTFLANKEVSSEKRDEKKHQQIEEVVNSYIQIQLGGSKLKR
jgi:hypothetical protein